MALVPKLPDIVGSSAKDRTLFIFDAVNSMRTKRTEKHQLFPHCTEHVNQHIRYPGTSSIALFRFLVIAFLILVSQSVKEPLDKPFINLKSLEWLIDIDKNYTDR